MATIFVEGLGEVQIQGDIPTAEEKLAISEALGLSTDTTTTETTDTPVVESEQTIDSITPEMIDPNLANVGKAQGLEKIGGR